MREKLLQQLLRDEREDDDHDDDDSRNGRREEEVVVQERKSRRDKETEKRLPLSQKKIRESWIKCRLILTLPHPLFWLSFPHLPSAWFECIVSSHILSSCFSSMISDLFFSFGSYSLSLTTHSFLLFFCFSMTFLRLFQTHLESTSSFSSILSPSLQ